VAALTAGAVGLGLAAAGGLSAAAYEPGPLNLYTAPADANQQCNKYPCILYPKSAQLPSGRLIAGFERSIGDPVGQTIPVYKSDDFGTTWQELSEVKPPAELSDDPAYADLLSNWTNPFFYALPQDVGDLAKGTLLLASVVSGDDPVYREKKGADPSWIASGDDGRQNVTIALFASDDEGATWRVLNEVARGGSHTKADGNGQADPVWEPFLMVYDDQLVCYYSDEGDFVSYDPDTGVPVRAEDDDTGPDTGGQILAHKVWDGFADSEWSEPVVDVPGNTVTDANGQPRIGGGRPGMTSVVPTTDGKWMLTFEFWSQGDDNQYKIADDPLKFFADGQAAGANVASLPRIGTALANGGSPVLIGLPDGRLAYNASGSKHIWVNESGASNGQWRAYQSPVAAGYSRNLQYVEGTGRVVVLQATWGGSAYGPVRHGEVDLGYSDGAYYTLVNRATGLALTARSSQDPPTSGTDTADLFSQPVTPGNDLQRWHVVRKGTSVTLLNKAGGRAIGLWQGRTTNGTNATQWVDDGGADKLWSIEPTDGDYARLGLTSLSATTPRYLTGSGAAGTNVTLGDQVSNGTQDWLLVPEAPATSGLTATTAVPGLIGPSEVEHQATLSLDAAAGGLLQAAHASASGHGWAFVEGLEAPLDLGTISFDAQEKGAVSLPAEAVGAVKIAVLFDDTPLVWDTVSVAPGAARSLDLDVEVSHRCLAGKAYLTVQVTNSDDVAADLEISTVYGSKSFLSVAPGKSGFHSFTTRLAALPGGTMHVLGAGGSGPAARSADLGATYSSASCQ
jgi:hypothetical protein